ncbi:MAG: hypothetical protein ABSA11_05635 [Candidatus Bathyarchaeia archaeon]
MITHPKPDLVLEMTAEEATAFIDDSKGLVVRQAAKNGAAITWLLTQGHWIMINPPSKEEEQSRHGQEDP